MTFSAVSQQINAWGLIFLILRLAAIPHQSVSFIFSNGGNLPSFNNRRLSKEKVSKTGCPHLLVLSLPDSTAQAMKSPAMATALGYFASATSQFKTASKSTCDVLGSILQLYRGTPFILALKEASSGLRITSCLPQTQRAADPVVSVFEEDNPRFLY